MSLSKIMVPRCAVCKYCSYSGSTNETSGISIASDIDDGVMNKVCTAYAEPNSIVTTVMNGKVIKRTYEPFNISRRVVEDLNAKINHGLYKVVGSSIYRWNGDYYAFYRSIQDVITEALWEEKPQCKMFVHVNEQDEITNEKFQRFKSINFTRNQDINYRLNGVAIKNAIKSMAEHLARKESVNLSEAYKRASRTYWNFRKYKRRKPSPVSINNNQPKLAKKVEGADMHPMVGKKVENVRLFADGLYVTIDGRSFVCVSYTNNYIKKDTEPLSKIPSLSKFFGKEVEQAVSKNNLFVVVLGKVFMEVSPIDMYANIEIEEELPSSYDDISEETYIRRLIDGAFLARKDICSQCSILGRRSCCGNELADTVEDSEWVEPSIMFDGEKFVERTTDEPCPIWKLLTEEHRMLDHLADDTSIASNNPCTNCTNCNKCIKQMEIGFGSPRASEVKYYSL